jgi:hypothetical protein
MEVVMPYKTREEARNALRRWRAAHPEKNHEAWMREKARYDADPELKAKKLAKQKEWTLANMDRHKACVRKNHYLREHGITMPEFDAIFVAQDCKCGLCGKDKSGGHNWALDHDHKTGYIRGILCFACNAGAGKFKDDPDLLRKAADWFSNP